MVRFPGCWAFGAVKLFGRNGTPRLDKQRILDYQFSVHSFSADTDDREILQIFARMNSTGVKLNAQELRNAELWGAFKQTAYEIATEQLNRWGDWQVFRPDQIARMNEVELVSHEGGLTAPISITNCVRDRDAPANAVIRGPNLEPDGIESGQEDKREHRPDRCSPNESVCQRSPEN